MFWEIGYLAESVGYVREALVIEVVGKGLLRRNESAYLFPRITEYL